jgi:hypothetical protein
MEIMFVEHENDQAMFYTLGRGRGGNVYVYALKMKELVFSNERIYTGTAEIDDNIRDYYTRSQLTMSLSTGLGTYEPDEIVFQSPDRTLANATAQATVHTWTKAASARTLDVYRVMGTFANASNTIGATSGAYYTTSGTINDNAFDNNAFENIIDNTRIESESDSIIDFTEVNPFGEA